LSGPPRSFLAVALLLIFATPALAQQGVAGPKWSRDGNLITFAALEGGTDWEVFAIRSDGTGVRQLTRNEFTDIYPSFSNDGSTIYFASTQDRGENQRNDLDIAKISPNGGASGPRGLFVQDVATGDVREIWRQSVNDE